MAFGEYLKGLRQAKGISQKELSGLTNGQVSNAEISRLEAGIRKKPSPAVLKILAPHLGVSVGVLLTEAGYMDGLPSDMAASGQGAPGGAGGVPDSVQLARLQSLEREKDALKEENKKIRDESDSFAKRSAQLEATYKDLQAANKELEEKCDYLLLQSRPAEEINSNLEEEIRVLRTQNENMKEENRRIKEETIAFLEEGSSLRAETDSYRKKMNLAEEAARQARQRQGALEEELEGALGKNSELEARVKTLEESAGQANMSAWENEAAGKDREIAELKRLNGEASARYEQLSGEKKVLEQELLAARETTKLNAPVLDSIRNVKAGDLDLGKIFTDTVSGAAPEDLDMLGRIMQAINKDAIKPGDKRMLMDILKRFVK